MHKRVAVRSLLTLILLLVLMLCWLAPPGSRLVRASSSSIPLFWFSHVPSAAVDGLGNRFVFWQDRTSSNLDEGFYQFTMSRWHGPLHMGWGPGPLFSEPSVTVVTTSQSIARGYAYQYVFWQGGGPAQNLWEVYWDGSWHGPTDLGMGSLATQPSATTDPSTGIITVTWMGMDGNVWYAYDMAGTTPSHQSWSGPHKAGWGPLGGPPTAAASGGGAVQVFWYGQDYHLWHGTLLVPGGPTFGPQRLGSAGQLGSQPCATGYVGSDPFSVVYTVFWAGLDHGLWAIDWYPGGPSNPGGSTDIVHEFPHMGPLGSAPGCASEGLNSQGNSQEFCFWAGATDPYNLWEAVISQSGVSANRRWRALHYRRGDRNLSHCQYRASTYRYECACAKTRGAFSF